MAFITRRSWAVAPTQSKGTAKGLKVINSVDPGVLNFNLSAAVATK